MLVISIVEIVANALLGYRLIFGNFSFLAHQRVFGSGFLDSDSPHRPFLAMMLAVVIITDRQFRRFHTCSERLQAGLAALLESCWKLGFDRARNEFPEGGVFSAAAYSMGLIDAGSVAAHAVAPDRGGGFRGFLGLESGNDSCAWVGASARATSPGLRAQAGCPGCWASASWR